MNHIYEQKAKKYKYKYLKLKKLKNELEYIGEGGGFFQRDGDRFRRVGYHSNNDLNEIIDKDIKKLSGKEIQQLSEEDITELLKNINNKNFEKGPFYKFLNYNIHTSDGIEHKINEEIKKRLENEINARLLEKERLEKERLENEINARLLEKERLEKERLENARMLEKERLQKREILKNQLILLKGEIEQKIVPLYQQYFVGNITNEIINGSNIFIDDGEKIDINNNNQLETLTDNVKNAIEQIAKHNKKSIYLPPIIKCFFQIPKTRGSTILKKKFLESLIECLNKSTFDENKSTFDENKIILLFDSLDKSDFSYHMYYIYREHIRQFEKNIDYYALTKVICDLYYDFYYNYIIENNLFSENENNLEKLFINLENDFINNKIEKDNFLEQLNNIINAF